MSPHDEREGTIDADLLAGYAEGRLGAEERDAVEARLVHDEDARALLLELRDALPAGGADAAPVAVAPHVRRWPLVAVAAVVILAVGVLWVFGSGEDPEPSRGLGRLLAAADALAAEHPERFGDLRAGIEAEGASVSIPVERGSLVVLLPRGEVLSTRPVLQWSAIAGAERYELRVATEAGEDARTYTATTTRFALPDDGPPLTPGGRYLLEVRAQGVFGATEATGMFRVADLIAREDAEGAVEAIHAAAQGMERDLLLAFYALANERYSRAVELLGRLEAADPDHEGVRRLRARLGPLAEC